MSHIKDVIHSQRDFVIGLVSFQNKKGSLEHYLQTSTQQEETCMSRYYPNFL